MRMRPGQINSLAALAPAAVSYDSDASAFFARMSTDPGATRKELYNTLVLALKTGAVSGSNIWAKLDILYLLAAHEQSTALLNLKGATYDATLPVAPTFTADLGFTGNGSTQYISTGFVVNAGGSQWAQDNAFMGVYVNQDGGSTTLATVGLGNGSNTVLNPLGSSTNRRARIHCTTNASVACTDRLGWTSGSRTGSTSSKAYYNETASANNSTASSALETVNNTVFILRSAATYVTDRAAAFALGSGLTDNENTDLKRAVLAYLTAIGAN